MSYTFDHQLSPNTRWLPRARLQDLIDVLKADGRRCIGPQPRDGAIVFDTLTRVDQLPADLQDQQSPGRYRMQRNAGQRCFDVTLGPQAIKPLMFMPREVMWHVARDADGRLHFDAQPPHTARIAVIGVRACDLAALELQDRHFMNPDGVTDVAYAARRAGLLTIAVNCTRSAETCFCVSTGDGPAAHKGYDLALTETDTGFTVNAGSADGERLVTALDLAEADLKQIDSAAAAINTAASQQTAGLPGRDLRVPLMAAPEHPRWHEVAARCLACGNCTMVCPTCFCHTGGEHPALDGTHSEHLRSWDSCFTPGHSFMAGRVLRDETRLRYRQWLTHKLATWHDQYGRSGCVGCGRCITWCPVGIDIREEAAALCKGAA